MGIINVFKTIGKGLVEVGKGAAKVVDIAEDVVTHPAAAPATMVLSMVVPVAMVAKGIAVVRSIKATADVIRHGRTPDMTDEDKRALFREEMRAEYPNASNGDLDTLAGALVKLEKSGGGGR